MADFTDTDLDTPTEADLNELYGSKYLGAVDLGEKKIRTRIAKSRKEPMQQQGGRPERAKIVLYFTTLGKGLVLNATNKNVLVDALGRDPAKWANAEVGLFTIDTAFQGKPTKGVRLRVLSAPKTATKAAPASKPAPKKAAAAEEPMPWDDPEDPGFQGEEADFGEAAE
jgi:hypothetical protein